MTQDFNGFGLPAKLLQALVRLQYTTPTPIQAEAIPLALLGNNILGSAQTGTGKTGAFGIPLIARLMDHATATALVLTPTRELATQVAASLQQMIPVPALKIAVLIGGESMFRQLRELDHHPRIVVGTPGRINDHLARGSLKLDKAGFLVLDETDRMLDMGFGPQLDKIMEFMPKERQTMMFSATLPENIVKLSRKYLTDAKRIAVGSTTTPITKIKQEAIRVSDGDKYKILLAQLGQRTGSVIIFVKTKYGTEKLSDKLNKDAHRSDAIHGDLQQRRRDRVIQGFRDKKYRILVATDVAARGLDIPHIEHVINYDLPQCPEDYIHRIGRTARAGAEGAAVNFITPADNMKWNAIHKLMHGVNDPESRSSGGGSGERRPGSSFGRRGQYKGPPKKWTKPSGEGQSENRSGSRSPARAEARGSGHESHTPAYAPSPHRQRSEGQKFEGRKFESKVGGDRKPDANRSGGHKSEGRAERRPEGQHTEGRQRRDGHAAAHRGDKPRDESHRGEGQNHGKKFEGRKFDKRDHSKHGTGQSRSSHATTGRDVKPAQRSSSPPSTRAAS